VIRKQDALEYHSRGRKGKIEVTWTKPCATQRDLSLAYTPGVADPCREIAASDEAAYEYTAKGNLVAVVTNGTAVLGLGDIGPLAAKPVMEGKAVLFKRFADIDVFDLELDAKDPADVIRVVRALAPTFGGVNLEDIKAPECFEIEEVLRASLSIPVFHDDQHGTAIISGAALLNALELVGKAIDKVKVVFGGAGAAGIACAKFYVALGVRRENILLVDTTGVIYEGRRERMNPYKAAFAVPTKARTMADALEGADVFAGVSVAGALSSAMLVRMAKDPIVFAMANPDPEILPEEAAAARSDVLIATGRSDYPNQVNNVLGFPFIFRGALDVRATAIDDGMKLAAAHALAALAKEDVPDSVIKAYGGAPIHFGRDYIIPKPLDPRVLLWVAPAVAKAAMESGVARRPIADLAAYRDDLESRFGRGKEIMRGVIHKAQRAKKRIVFPEGVEAKVLRASQIILDEGSRHRSCSVPKTRSVRPSRARSRSWRRGDRRSAPLADRHDVCGALLRAAEAQRRHPPLGRAADEAARRFRDDDGRIRRRRRAGRRADAELPGHHPARAPDHRQAPRRPHDRGRLHARVEERHVLHHRRHRSTSSRPRKTSPTSRSWRRGR
jgi:malate dehydrogenase (oxaloacetate-decarboxylating)(NADP+)